MYFSQIYCRHDSDYESSVSYWQNNVETGVVRLDCKMYFRLNSEDKAGTNRTQTRLLVWQYQSSYLDLAVWFVNLNRNINKYWDGNAVFSPLTKNSKQEFCLQIIDEQLLNGVWVKMFMKWG